MIWFDVTYLICFISFLIRTYLKHLRKQELLKSNFPNHCMSTGSRNVISVFTDILVNDCKIPILGTSIQVDNFYVLWLPVTAYLKLCFRGTGQPCVPWYKALFLFPILGCLWHLKASCFVSGEPQSIYSFIHVPCTV